MELTKENGFAELSMDEMNEIDGGIPVWVVPAAKFVGKAIVKGVISGSAAYGTKKGLEAIFG